MADELGSLGGEDDGGQTCRLTRWAASLNEFVEACRVPPGSPGPAEGLGHAISWHEAPDLLEPHGPHRCVGEPLRRQKQHGNLGHVDHGCAGICLMRSCLQVPYNPDQLPYRIYWCACSAVLAQRQPEGAVSVILQIVEVLRQ